MDRFSKILENKIHCPEKSNFNINLMLEDKALYGLLKLINIIDILLHRRFKRWDPAFSFNYSCAFLFEVCSHC